MIIETWPQSGWRRVEPGTGNEGGITEGDFVMHRQGDFMIARNHAVDGYYIAGWFADPTFASSKGTSPDYSRVLIREANYHPDGAKFSFPEIRPPLLRS